MYPLSEQMYPLSEQMYPLSEHMSTSKVVFLFQTRSVMIVLASKTVLQEPIRILIPIKLIRKMVILSLGT